MKINILLFGPLIDIVGKNNLSLSDIKDTDELNNKLHREYPGLKNHTYRIAVNQEMIEENTRLADGDEVALLPPFSGG